MLRPHSFLAIVSAVLVAWMLSDASGTRCIAQEGPAALTTEQTQFFDSKIRPALIEHCYRCHSTEGQSVRGGLSVDYRDGLLEGGESGPAVVPGNLDDSLLWNAINYQDYRMPPDGRMPAEVIEDFKTWIEMGAPDPRVPEGVIVHSRVTAEDIQEAKAFWAFQPPSRSEPGLFALSAWPATTIDRFIAAEWDRHSLLPADDCEPRDLLRRITFDLVGLPPTPEQTARFLVQSKKDVSAAVDALVEELLAQPQYGERWARHWLDIARYAESTGKESDVTLPHAWRYRDYVVRSFNQDKPYDEFVMEQVAGDLLPAENDQIWNEHLIATGFLAIGPKSLTEQNPRQFQADLVDEQLDTMSRVVLGLSVGCARCHDHKFDPIPQSDYYALAGIFQSTETYFGGIRSIRNRQPSNLIRLPVQDTQSAQSALTRQELDALRQELRNKEQELVEARRAQRMAVVGNNDGNRRNNSLLNVALLDQIVAQLSARLASVDESGRPVDYCMGVQDRDTPRDARLLVRGELSQPAQEVPRGLLQILSNEPVQLPADSSGRLELARWLVSRENPLTARVMVNRIWQHLLGQALVREPDNFGMSGPAPTHPELLDHLAVEFMDHDWSVKHMVRTIVRSRVYRLDSKLTPEILEADAENRWWARGQSRRLDAESIRDAMLAVSGQLDLKPPRASLIARYGTASIGPNGPVNASNALLSAISPTMSENRTPEQRAEQLRQVLRAGVRNTSVNVFELPDYHRSLYLPVPRNSLPRVLDAFDFAEPSLVVGTREVSNTAEQALYLLNNPFVIELSDSMARRVIQHSQDARQRVLHAFQLAYGRQPTEDEMQAANRFFRRGSEMATAKKREEQVFQLMSQFCQALLGSAEFRIVN